MTKKLWLSPAIAMLAAVTLSGAGLAQTTPAAPKADSKAAPKAAAKPAAKPAEAKPKSDPTESAVLLGQFGDWGAYRATPGGKKVCFALAKPSAATTEPANKKRDPSYAFISTRPAEKVKNEVSVIVGYPQKANIDATAVVGGTTYVMYTQNDGAWVKNPADEAKLVSALRNGGELVVKSESGKNTKSTDTFSLKGIAQALDKVAEECK